MQQCTAFVWKAVPVEGNGGTGQRGARAPDAGIRPSGQWRCLAAVPPAAGGRAGGFRARGKRNGRGGGNCRGDGVRRAIVAFGGRLDGLQSHIREGQNPGCSGRDSVAGGQTRLVCRFSELDRCGSGRATTEQHGRQQQQAGQPCQGSVRLGAGVGGLAGQGRLDAGGCPAWDRNRT